MPKMKYTFSSYQSMSDPLYLRGYFRDKSEEWSSNVDAMSDGYLVESYKKAILGSSLLKR